MKPCKVGDTVYQTDTNGTKIFCSTIRSIIFGERIIYDTDGVAFDEQAIGKSIYLSKEEAEAHLRKLQENP